MTFLSRPIKFITLLALCGVVACNEKVVVEEPRAAEGEEAIVGVDTPPLYIGVWAADEASCNVAPGAPGPVEFTKDQFLGYENTCDILSSEEGTEGGWRLEARCTGEGETVDEIFDVDLDGERLRVSRNGGEPVTFVACGDGEG